MTQIATDAGVSIDTIYAAIGPKPSLFRLLLETALSGGEEAVPALERGYVDEIRAASSATGKLTIYARAVSEIQQRLAPLFVVLRSAAGAEPELTALWNDIAQRRARNMRLFAAELIATGEVRHDLDEATAADIIWSMNASEYYALLVFDRGWSPQRFEQWVSEAWCRLLLGS